MAACLTPALDQLVGIESETEIGAYFLFFGQPEEFA